MSNKHNYIAFVSSNVTATASTVFLISLSPWLALMKKRRRAFPFATAGYMPALTSTPRERRRFITSMQRSVDPHFTGITALELSVQS